MQIYLVQLRIAEDFWQKPFFFTKNQFHQNFGVLFSENDRNFEPWSSPTGA